jgi:hypothetical protein
VNGKARQALVALALLALVAGGAWVRMAVALRDPGFDRAQPVGMLKSDPALLYYFTARVVEADGLLPDDLRHDPRVEHPRGADLAAEFTLGQELLVGWTFPRLAFGAPLHVHAQRVMALAASFFVVGVFLIARAASGRAALGLLAALLAALLPACYRTIGFVLVREDLSLPLFALGAGCAAAAARAAGRRGALWALGAGLALAAAAATWHAMAFVLALFALALGLAYVWSGANPLAGARGRVALVPLVVAAVVVPALRASGFLLSPALIAAAVLLACAALDRRAAAAGAGPAQRLRARRALACAALLLAFGGLGYGAARLGWTGQAAMGHVYEVLWAKVRFLGQRPLDPHAVSFDARLLWQGPFETLDLAWGLRLLGIALPLGALGLARLARRGPDVVELPLLLFALLALPASWLVARLVVLPGLALPALAGVPATRAAGRAGPARAGTLVLVAACALQLALFARFAARYEISWYKPAGAAPELRALVEAVRARVPENEAICADFVNSPALLAHTRRPIVLQPKYETDASRRDAEAFLTTFFHGTPGALATLMRERFRCRYLVVDRYTLGVLSRWTAGLASDPPAPGTAAAVLLSQDAARLGGVPGFELLYRSPPTILQSNGAPYDLYRLYRLTDE